MNCSTLNYNSVLNTYVPVHNDPLVRKSSSNPRQAAVKYIQQNLVLFSVLDIISSNCLLRMLDVGGKV